jgi:hypothetical protein
MTAATSALIAGGAIAQETAPTGINSPVTTEIPADDQIMAPEFNSISEMTVGDIIGQNVYEADGDIIGDIDYVVGHEGAAHAVIGIGGLLGLGEYTVALPLADFTYDGVQQMVKVDTTKALLKEQPEFDETDVEGLPDDTWLKDLMVSSDMSAPAPMTEEVAPMSDPTTGTMTDDATPGIDTENSVAPN